MTTLCGSMYALSARIVAGISNAINIPHGDIGHEIFVEVPDTFKKGHLYDGSQGTIAGIALEMLMEIGFQEVVNEGGYDALLEKQGLNEK
jgi:rhodanese-related sulfurtransferase